MFYSLGIFHCPCWGKSAVSTSTGRGLLVKLSCIRGWKTGCGVPLAAGCCFIAFLLARVSCTWGVFTSVYLLSQCTFTCDGKHGAHLRESKRSHMKGGKQMHYWVTAQPCQMNSGWRFTDSCHSCLHNMYVCMYVFLLKDAADCLRFLFSTNPHLYPCCLI